MGAKLPPRASDATPRPAGALRFAWFDGILEGPRGDEDALHRAEARLRALGIARAGLELDGPRFSLLFDDTPLSAGAFDETRREEVLDVVQALVETSGARGEIESTLRLTEVFEQGTRETLLAVVAGELRPVGRVRPTNEHDLRHAPAGPPVAPVLALGPRRLALVALSFFLFFGLVAWRSGWVDRVFAQRADELGLELGPFAGLLVVEVESWMGRYEVALRRGPEYPSDPAALERLLAASEHLGRRAAVNALADGAALFARLERADGRVLECVEVVTAPLLDGPEGRVRVRLDGHMAGARLRLALDDGRDR